MINASDPVLILTDVCKSFGGLQATDNVSLTLYPHERVGLIGANGAGKSTLFNQISGMFQPDSGSIVFNGRSIVGLLPQQIVRLGMGRAFQRANVFPRLSVTENLQVAILSHQRQHLDVWLLPTARRALQERTDALLEQIGLQAHRRQMAGALALGDQKRLELGLALALEPRLLLLDEPTAGMSAEETYSTVELIQQLVQSFGMTLFFSEHDMAVVFGMAQRIYVLHQGALIAEGTPDQIAHHPHVQQVYLGTTNDAPFAHA
ncbi:MAG: ABC transporter ATP-binding protein [Phototrophicaceae bacterium]